MATLESGIEEDMQAPAAPDARAPSPGERAVGHGVEGVIVAVAKFQPLAAGQVWRVTLAGEPVGRLVSPRPDGVWHLLQLDELTDAQLDVLEAATDTPPVR
jgi:hypothetical protein